MMIGDNNSNSNDFIQRIVSTWMGKILVGAVAVLATLRYGGGLYAYLETEKLERPSYEVLRRLKGTGVEIRLYQPYLIAETITSKEGFEEAGREGFAPCAGYIFGKNKSRKNRRRNISSFSLPSWVSGASASPGNSATTSEGRKKMNDNSEKMSMTAPVRLEGVGEMVDDETNSSNKKKKKTTRVSFVIGSNYTLDTVPVPIEKDKVKIRQVPGHTLAVKTFSGPPPTDDRVRKERQKLLTALQDANVDLPETLLSSSSSRGGTNKNNNVNDDTLVYGYHDPFITPNFLRRNEVAVVLEGSV